MDPEICLLSERFRNSGYILADEIFCTVLYILLLLILFYLVMSKKYSMCTFHFNFKLILYNVWLITFIQTAWGIASNVYFIFIKFYFTDYCGNAHVAWQCALIKWPLLMTVPAMSFVHLIGFVERTMATRFSRNYEKSGKKCGVFWMIVTWIIILLINYQTFRIPDYQIQSPYCMVTVQANQSAIRNLINLLLPLDIIVTIGDLGVFWLNKNWRRKSIFSDYSLSKSFQQRENYITSHLVLPVSLTHSLLFMLYLGVTSIFRYFNGYGSDPVSFVAGLIFIHNILIIAFTGSLLVYMSSLKVMERERNITIVRKQSENTELYFRILRKQLQRDSF